MKTAKKADWKTLPLTSKRAVIQLNRTFTVEEIDTIRKGLIPREMEDKWFIYWEDDTLFFHRSWTGFCMYIVHFLEEKDKYSLISADINRDPDQYKETSNERDMKIILYLIDVLLLHKSAVFPDDDSEDNMEPLKKWSQIGRAMLGQHPDNV